MSFLPISILAYILVAGAVVVDKILLKKAVSTPLAYAIYVNLLQFTVLLLIPFGFSLTFQTSTYLAISSGFISVFALITFFYSLKLSEASLVSPLIGAFTPLLALLIEWLILGQTLAPGQYLAILVLTFGTIIFTHTEWTHHFQLSHRLSWMLLSGFLFALSFVLLRQAFLQTSFINGLVISRVSAGFLALILLISPTIRSQVLDHHRGSPLVSRRSFALMIFGQIMGGASGLLITFAITLASASLVNSLFGVQYLAILAAALILAKKYPHVLGEKLSKRVAVQKLAGVAVLSLGLYLLAQ